MLAVIIIIGAALSIAAYFGLCDIFQELEDFEERAKNFADLMDEADELSNDTKE